MPWVRIDDQFPDHPKVVEAGPLAGWLYVCGLAYCARQLTDGFIPAAQVSRLTGGGSAARLTARLVDVGLWETATGGYRVHDYLEYNPTRAQTLAKREIRASAGQRGGKQKASNLLERKQPDATDMYVANGYPVPVPHPVPHEAATQTEHLRTEETARAPAAVLEQARAFAVPKPGLAPGSPQVALSRALASALNCAEPTTTSERRKWSDAIREMLHATPAVCQGEVPRLVAVFQERNNVPCTPQGIVNQLAQLRSDQPPARSNGHPKPTRESPMEQARRLATERREASA